MISKCKFLGNDENTSRFLKYWADLYNNISKGSKYSDLTKTIVILFIDYEDNLIDNIPKIDTSWHIREDTYSQIVLTDSFEFHIISLRKLNDFAILEDSTKKILIAWLNFLKNSNLMEVNKMDNESDYEALKAAKKEFEKIQQNEQDRELARLREKYIWEMNSAEEHGIKKGLKESSLKIAKKMKNANKSIEEIIKFTELTREEIEKL